MSNETMVYQRIMSSSDIAAARNKMAKGNYPLGMTDCEVVGINGDCGSDCPLFLKGLCDVDMLNEEEDDEIS